MSERKVSRSYRDPLDEIWLRAASELNLTIKRTRAAYATYDGRGVLELAQACDFDPDDSLAQMIFHELCHALVAGPDAFSKPDWGMSNYDDRDVTYEHACVRLQAALSERHGLRGFMAVTTEHRAYWDALPDDPFRVSAPEDERAVALARDAFMRARRGPVGDALERALSATAKIAEVVRPISNDESLWAATTPLHASGFAQNADPGKTCASCAWLYSSGGAPAVLRCRQTKRAQEHGVRVTAEARACVRHEAKLDDASCAACGACCREGFDLVPVRARDRVRKLHPALVHEDRHGLHIPRPSGRCLALQGMGTAQAAYRCRIYPDRPQACAEFEMGGDACLMARRRVVLSR